MEYNTQRDRLPLPEYGRNLQKMVNNVMTIQDREKRTRFAHLLVEIMIQLHPNSKDSAELRHKLWDHLHIMSNFRLDIDSPFPVPDKETLTKQPKPLSYPVRNLRHNYYGRNIQQMIEETCKMEDGEEKDLLTISIANQMKTSYLLWNKDTVDDNLILQHLAEFSRNNLSLPDNSQLKQTHEIVSRPKKKQKSQKGGIRRKNK